MINTRVTTKNDFYNADIQVQLLRDTYDKYHAKVKSIAALYPFCANESVGIHTKLQGARGSVVG
jgi:hypothetical protein